VIGLYVGLPTIGIFALWFTHDSFIRIEFSAYGHTLLITWTGREKLRLLELILEQLTAVWEYGCMTELKLLLMTKETGPLPPWLLSLPMIDLLETLPSSRFQLILVTLFDAKRLIGRRYNDPSVQADKKLWPFTIVPGNNDKPMVEVAYKGERKLFAAEEISSMVLVKMKMVAEEYLKCDVENAVITVPAYFNESQKRATKDAGKIAGLNVMQIINEPTAAAITYGFNALKEETRNILVFDLGGGTFDVSIATVERGKIEVKAVAGDMHLGGEDFDNRMLSYCVQQFNKKYNMDMSISSKALRRLRSECERAKRSLSSAVETVIDIDCLHEGQDFYTKIRRAKFNELNALRAAALNKEEFQLVLVDVTPLSLGIEVSHGVMQVVVPRNTPIPTLKETNVTTMYDNQTSVAFRVYEGERPLVAHNNMLDEFVLNGILPARCGVPSMSVFFQVNMEGILTVSAQDRGTGINNQITVTNEREKLSKDEINRMVANADIYRKEDEEAAKKLLAKNTLECYVCNMKSRVMEAKIKGTMGITVAEDLMRALNDDEEWLDENERTGVHELQAKLN
ncbi:hypothetical protein KI387_031249, partial [Taxus chinensis]